MSFRSGIITTLSTDSGGVSAISEGQGGKICFLAAHPTLPNTVVTLSTDGFLYVWTVEPDTDSQRVVGALVLPFKNEETKQIPTSATFCDSNTLLVGTSQGSLAAIEMKLSESDTALFKYNLSVIDIIHNVGQTPLRNLKIDQRGKRIFATDDTGSVHAYAKITLKETKTSALPDLVVKEDSDKTTKWCAWQDGKDFSVDDWSIQSATLSYNLKKTGNKILARTDAGDWEDLTHLISQSGTFDLPKSMIGGRSIQFGYTGKWDMTDISISIQYDVIAPKGEKIISLPSSDVIKFVNTVKIGDGKPLIAMDFSSDSSLVRFYDETNVAHFIDCSDDKLGSTGCDDSISWSTTSSMFSPEASGVAMYDNAIVIPVTSISRVESKAGSLLAAGYKNGACRIFNYPVINVERKGVTLSLHSAGNVLTTFTTPDDNNVSNLVTANNNDNSIMVWNVDSM